jgi:hypothetical protein
VTSDSALLEQPASTSDALTPIRPTVMNLLRIVMLLSFVHYDFYSLRHIRQY